MLLIDRAELVRRLETLEAGGELAIAQGRRQRLLDSLEKVRRHRAAAAIRIPTEGDATDRSVACLPAGICLLPGSLQVDFRGAQDLLSKLFQLARALSDDFESFQALVN